MAARRNIFTPEYGTAPIPKSGGRANLPPPDTRPQQRLGLEAGQAPPPPQASPQAAPQGPDEAIGAEGGAEGQDIGLLLQQLLTALGGQRG